MRFYNHLACIAVLVVIAVALIHHSLIGGKVLLPADLLLVMTPWRYHARQLFPQFRRVHAPLLDVIQQYYPWRKLYSESIRDGELPLWNPYMFSGTTFVGNGQSAIFYPLNFIFVVMPVDLAFGWFVLIHLLIAALGMYALLSLWRIRPPCALIGACAFMLCGFLMAWLNYITLVCTAVWLPTVIAAHEYVLKRVGLKNSLMMAMLWAVLVSVPLALTALAGHMQIAFYVWLAFAIYAAVRCVQCTIDGLKRGGYRAFDMLLHHIVVSTSAISFALMLSAPQLLPSIELSTMSTRAGEFKYEAVLANSLPPEQWIRLVVPHFFGNYRDGTHWSPFEMFNFIERTGYAGLLTLMLASVGCAFRHPMRPYAVLMLLIGFLLAIGSPVCLLFGMLPGVRQMVGVSRALLIFDFAVAALAAMGAEAIHRAIDFAGSERAKCSGKQKGFQTPAATRLILAPCAIAVAMMAFSTIYGVTCFWEVVTSSDIAGYVQWQICKAALLLSFSCIVLAMLSSHRTRRAFMIAAICLIVADLFSFAYGLHPSCDRRMVFFWTDSLRLVKANVGEYRVMAIGTDAIKHWMPSNTPMVYRLRDVQGSDSLWTARYANFLKCIDADLPGFSLSSPDSQLVDLASVKFFISGAPIEMVAGGKPKNVKRFLTHDMWLYENIDVMPRAFMVTNWRIASSPKEALQFIRDGELGKINLRETAIIEPQGEIASPVLSASKSVRGSAKVLIDGLNKLKLLIRSNGTQMLIVSDAFYPGWRAYIDGKPVPVHISNYAFRGVLIPDGEHSLWLAYEPTSISVGIFTVCIFMAFVCGCVIACKITVCRL
ncbi:MAG: YfhO family protein [Armatimonadetes bacterium]|nr:YfhO family protein [Armatimonadota bacterium]MCX7776845.1 YfhO family protein [Armatimonadota bacterium]